MLVTKGKYFLKYYPQHMLLLSLVISTCIATLLLALPICRTQDVSWIDLLFTATSLTTVTGMITVPMTSFTTTGHCIMLFFMQLGGLGLMTLSLSFMYMFSNLGIYTQVMASEILSIKSFKDTKYTLFFVIKLTAFVELLGSILILPTMLETYPLKKALFLSFFHSVSSFCNAGFCLFPDGMTQYFNQPIMLYTTTLLMIMGGLGFVTWKDLINKYWYKRPTMFSSNWHTKLVLRMYLVTAAISGILFFILERNNSLAHLSWFEMFNTVGFTSIAMKSTGFSIVCISCLHIGTLFIYMISMFIGSAPLSTGSGIKTSVFAVYLAVIKAAIQGKRHAMLYQRHIIDDQVYKAMAIIALSISWIIFIIFGLLCTQPSWNFLEIVFTSIAAFSNNGTILSNPATLTIVSKIYIICSMLIGRIGALAIILSIKRIGELRDISYPKEHIILG